jgi:hypothetical protein
MKVLAIHDGVESCHFGFLLWHVVARMQDVNRLHGNFSQVLEIYDKDEVGLVRKNKSIHNHGMASHRLLDDVFGRLIFFYYKTVVYHPVLIPLRSASNFLLFFLLAC